MNELKFYFNGKLIEVPLNPNGDEIVIEVSYPKQSIWKRFKDWINNWRR